MSAWIKDALAGAALIVFIAASFALAAVFHILVGG